MPTVKEKSCPCREFLQGRMVSTCGIETIGQGFHGVVEEVLGLVLAAKHPQ
jgi:hypothetical protein